MDLESIRSRCFRTIQMIEFGESIKLYNTASQKAGLQQPNSDNTTEYLQYLEQYIPRVIKNGSIPNTSSATTCFPGLLSSKMSALPILPGMSKT